MEGGREGVRERREVRGAGYTCVPHTMLCVVTLQDGSRKLLLTVTAMDLRVTTKGTIQLHTV